MTSGPSAREIVQTEYTSAPPGPAPPAPAARIRSCRAASSPIASGRARQRRSGRDWSVPRPLHGGSTSTRSNGPSAAARRAVPHLDPHARGAQPRRRALERGGPARVALDRDDLAPIAHQRGQMRGLAARRGAQVEHPLARLGIEDPRDQHRGARLRLDRAGLPQLRSLDVERTVEHEALGQAGGGPARRREGAATSGTAAISVLTRSADSAGWLTTRRSARASLAPSSCHHWLASQPGTEWRSAAPSAVPSSRLSQDARPLARGPAQDRVDESRRVGTRALGQLDALVDRGVVGGAAQDTGARPGRAGARPAPAGSSRSRRRDQLSASITWSSVARRWTAA